MTRRFVVALFSVDPGDSKDADTDGAAQKIVTDAVRGDYWLPDPTYLYIGTVEPHVCDAAGQPLTTGTD